MLKKMMLAVLACGVVLPAAAQVKVEDAWVRGTVAAQKATGAFMRLTAETDMRLVAASSPVAEVTQVHEMTMVDDVMKMREVDGVTLTAGKVVELKPGGYHIMLMSLHGQVAEGDMVPITLTFEDMTSGAKTEQEIVAKAVALGAGSPMMKGMGEHGSQEMHEKMHD